MSTTASIIAESMSPFIAPSITADTSLFVESTTISYADFSSLWAVIPDLNLPDRIQSVSDFS